MTVSESFSVNLRQRRLSLGLTQKQLGYMLGYSEKSVSKWESGETVPPSILLPALSGILRVSIDDLFNHEHQICFLGIDGGGTKTELVLTYSNQKVIRTLLPL